MADNERDEIKRWKFIAALMLIVAAQKKYSVVNAVLKDVRKDDSFERRTD